MEDTYNMKDLTQNLIAEVKQKNFLEYLWRQNTIEFDHYFKYSGKVEKSTETYSSYENNILEFDKFHKKNRHKIIRKIQRYTKILKKQKAKDYKLYKIK